MQSRVVDLWFRAPGYLLYFLIGYIIFLGLNIAVSNIGIVPGYDALAYVNAAMRINHGLIGADLDSFSWVDATGSVRWVGLPFTNTLDVLLIALLYNIVDYHVAIWFIHSCYILLFAYFLRKIFSPAATLMFFVWAVSHIYSLHQYTNLISEMKVGMFLALFIAYLFHADITSHLKSLFWITVLLLLFRTINLLFILPLVATYVAVSWRKGASQLDVISVLKVVGLAFLILSPLLLHEIRYLIPYIYKASYSDMAQNWRDMAGTQGKLDLLKAYADGIVSYNRYFSVVAMVTICSGVVLYLTSMRDKLHTVAGYLVGALVVFAVLMLAQTNNIMVVYWLFILLGLITVSLMSAVLKEKHLIIIACLMVLMAVRLNYVNFTNSNIEMKFSQPVAELVKGLSESITEIENPVVVQNYAGIGPLDYHGLEVASGKVLRYPVINNISYETGISDYLAVLMEANVVFIANKNYMWPSYLGINNKTEEIADFVNDNVSQLGLRKLTRLYYDSNPSQYIDVYTRPVLEVKLKYMRFNDNWLDRETTFVIKTGKDEPALDGYRIELNVMVPAVVDKEFSLPFKAFLLDDKDKAVGVVNVDHAGDNKLVYALDGLKAGLYRLVFEKTFSPPNDARKLVAQYLNAELKFAPEKPIPVSGEN